MLFRSDSLPGDLPEGFVFISALNSNLLQGDISQIVLPEGGYLNFNLTPPAENGVDKPFVFFWDEYQNDGMGGWVNIPSCLGLEPITIASGNSEEQRQVTQCVVMDPLRIEFTTNFPGLFVLVKKEG